VTDTQSTAQPWDRAKRDFEICTRYLNGEKPAQIAIVADITPERVRQIVRKAGITVADFGRNARESAGGGNTA